MLILDKTTLFKKTFLSALTVSSWIMLVFFITPLAACGETQTPTLIITEVMYDPAGEDTVSLYGQPRPRNRQWLELYNQSSLPIEIKGGIGEAVWTFVDSTGTHFFAKSPAQGSLIIDPKQYIILAGDAYVFLQEYPGLSGTVIDVRMELRHDYDFIQIKNEKGEVMAQALWSYNIGANGNGKTLEFYGRDDVRESILTGCTPGGPNHPQNPGPVLVSPSPLLPKETITTEPYPRPLLMGKIVINELAPDSAGRPGWTELRNTEPYPVDINGWRLNSLEKSFVIPTTTVINPYGFAIFSLIVPSPAGDVIKLFNRQNALIFEVEYETPIPESW